VQSFRVELGSRSHPVHVGCGLLDQLGELSRAAGLDGRTAIVTDTNVGALYLQRVRQALSPLDPAPVVIEIKAGEASKSLDTLAQIYGRLVEARLDRHSLMVALGGGVIGDLAGFAAATFLRGVGLVHVPTSLLAQVDSALGGKTGINHPLGKNLIGAFYQPRLIVADITVLGSLPEREFREGLAEVVKYAVVMDEAMFTQLEQEQAPILRREPLTLEHFVARCLRHKATIVERDEYEEGARALLNFGHTVGHALEVATGYGTLLHGEAVAVGMIAEARISQVLAGFDVSEAIRLQRWLESMGLPTELPADWKSPTFLEALALDKKRQGEELRFIGLRKIGQVTALRVTLPQLLHQLANLRASGGVSRPPPP
jgi:3-dehydroquinate synthase